MRSKTLLFQTTPAVVHEANVFFVKRSVDYSNVSGFADRGEFWRAAYEDETFRSQVWNIFVSN